MISNSLTSKDAEVIGQAVPLLNVQGCLETILIRDQWLMKDFGLVSFCVLVQSPDRRDGEGEHCSVCVARVSDRSVSLSLSHWLLYWGVYECGAFGFCLCKDWLLF